LIVTELNTEYFRLLECASVQFMPGLNAIIGPNATGKTSVLEAIGFCLRGRSVIGAQDDEIPTFGKTSFFCGISCTNSKRSKVEVVFDGRKSVKADGKSIRSSKELVDLFKLVVISPSSTIIATGAPSLRRDFLDDTASQINPVWGNIVVEYRNTVRDRNALLKKDFSANLMDVLNTQLVQHGKILREIRREIVGNLNEINQKKQIKIELTEHDQLCEKDFKKYQTPEKMRGITLVGPHRDECSFLLQGQKVERFASTGEARTVILALKTAQADLIAQISSFLPLILADDLIAELDKERAKEALESLGKYPQVLLTCAGELPKIECSVIEAKSWKK
jgi:DNA replication and repair protein RecF